MRNGARCRRLDEQSSALRPDQTFQAARLTSFVPDSASDESSGDATSAHAFDEVFAASSDKDCAVNAHQALLFDEDVGTSTYA